jgi:pimeloyl-ACP methyl ester carboxylesterase
MEAVKRLKEKLDAKDVVVIEGAGHLVMYDQPASINNIWHAI